MNKYTIKYRLNSEHTFTTDINAISEDEAKKLVKNQFRGGINEIEFLEIKQTGDAVDFLKNFFGMS